MTDKITLKNAMDNPAWMMVYAAEPTREVDVKMSYADLFFLYQWYHTYVPKDGEDTNVPTREEGEA